MTWKITLHWTAGSNNVTSVDKDHYHFIVDGDANVHEGKYTPEDNIKTTGGYAAHVARANTKNIGIALAGMRGAKESPLSYGDQPINKKQFLRAIDLIASLVKKYDISVSDKTVLTHAEIQPNLGIPQAGKWDITVLPWDTSIRGYKPVGDLIRELVKDRVGIENSPPVRPNRPLIRRGSRGEHVVYLQLTLSAKGYPVGYVDGIFGTKTDAQVRAFQRDSGLTVDGIVGNNTWRVLG